MSDFPTKDNPTLCKNGCGTKIYLSNKNERNKWLPYELDGNYHDCPAKPQLQPQQQQARKYTLEEVLRKFESIGVIINVDRIMSVLDDK